MLASDIPAVLARTRVVLPLGEGQIATVWADGCAITDLEGAPVAVEPIEVDWDVTAAQKGGYDWFMRKEIDEQPDAIRDTLVGRAHAGRLALDELRVPDDVLRELSKVFVVACGTAFHSGLVAKYAIEHWTRLPVEIEIASEFRYRDPVLGPDTLTLAVSQSGETIDTLEAARHARRQGSQVIAVTNTVAPRSRVRPTASCTRTRGPEIGVASTKTFATQMVAQQLVALYLAQVRGRDVPRGDRAVLDDLAALPEQVATRDRARRAGARDRRGFIDARDYLFIGRHTGYPAALEGALKLKELSYIHASGYPAGELKHGPIALVDGRAGRGDRDALPRLPEDAVEHPRGESARRRRDRRGLGRRHGGSRARGPRDRGARDARAAGARGGDRAAAAARVPRRRAARPRRRPAAEPREVRDRGVARWPGCCVSSSRRR